MTELWLHHHKTFFFFQEWGSFCDVWLQVSCKISKDCFLFFYIWLKYWGDNWEGNVNLCSWGKSRIQWESNRCEMWFDQLNLGFECFMWTQLEASMMTPQICSCLIFFGGVVIDYQSKPGHHSSLLMSLLSFVAGSEDGEITFLPTSLKLVDS